MAAEMETNNTAQYSPLNNLSSGEEIEQFSLPVTANVNKSKRRRKRREFDLLKAQSVVTHKADGACRLSACLVTFTFILLVAAVCGLSVLVYQLYVQVHELEKQSVILRTTAESRSTTLNSHLSRLDDRLDTERAKIADIKSVNQTVKDMDSRLEVISAKVSDLQETPAVKPVNSEQLRSLEEKLAQFGSEISSLQTDMATVQQQQRTNEARLDELDKKLSSDSAQKEITKPDLGELYSV